MNKKNDTKILIQNNHVLDLIRSQNGSYYVREKEVILSPPITMIESTCSISSDDCMKRNVEGYLIDIMKYFIEKESRSNRDVFKANGFLILGCRSVVYKEPVRNGEDYISVPIMLFSALSLHKYIPATLENKLKIRSLFESPF